MLLGYARVSTNDQKLDLQLAALTAAGVDPEQIRTNMLSGSTTNRPGLIAVIKAAREGDTIVVWRPDRVCRSIRDPLNLMQQRKDRGIRLRSLTEALDTVCLTVPFETMGPAHPAYSPRLQATPVHRSAASSSSISPMGSRTDNSLITISWSYRWGLSVSAGHRSVDRQYEIESRSSSICTNFTDKYSSSGHRAKIRTRPRW